MSVRRVCQSLALMLALAVLVPSVALASAGRIGGTFNASGTSPWASKRTDVAYDPVNDVYLIVSGPAVSPGTVFGRFLDGSGNPLGGNVFQIPRTTAFTAMPRVAYSADVGGFLVVWQDLRADLKGQVWGCFLKFQAGGTPNFLAAGDSYIDNATGGVFSEAPPAVACAAGFSECLVAWQQVGEINNDIHAIRVNTAGQLVGTEYFLTADTDWDTDPAVGFDPASGAYLVANAVYFNASNSGGLWLHRIKAGTGERTGPFTIATAAAITVPQVTPDPANNQFFVSWYDFGLKTYFGRFVNSDATPTSNAIPLLAGYPGYDALGMSYNTVSGTFIGVTHGWAIDDVAFQVQASGTPDPAFTATSIGTGKGAYYPRVAAHTARGEWMLSMSDNFAFVGAQRLGTSEVGGPIGPPPPPPPPTLIDLSPTGAPNGSWFLAEGVASNTPNGFKTFYEIMNPNPVDVSVRAYFSNDSGVASTKTFTVPRQSRTTVGLYDAVGPGQFGAVFQSLTQNADIDVERSVFWGPNLEGSTDATAIKYPGSTWYFAEGSRGGELFNNYFLLFNPTQTATVVTGHYYRADGQVIGHSYNLGPQQRYTVDANIIPELAGADFSATFTSSDNVPIVAERTMYWGWQGSSNLWIGGHGTVGAQLLNPTWYFAEGNAASNFESFYLLLNPNPHPISVLANFMTEFAGRIQKTYTIPANSRYTVYMNGELGNIGPSAVTFNTGGDLFLAERSIYWGNRVEGTNTIGAVFPAAVWDLPEGSTTGSFDTYTMLLNPNDHAVTVNVTVYIEGLAGLPFTMPANSVILPAFSRLTLGMRDVLNVLQAQAGGIQIVNSSFATRVSSVGGDPIVAEHAIYWNFVGGNIYWRSGGASLGIPR
jgi:hypothetical protein